MREDLTGLWQAKEKGCEKAREALVNRYLCLVPNTRLRRFRTAPERFWEEMESEGRLMLVRSVDEYDRFRGVQFPTYAIGKIWGAMAEVLRREDWTPRSERRKAKDGQPALIREVVSLSSLFAVGWESGEELPLADQIPDGSAPVEEQVISRLERQVLRRCVLWLSEREATILAASFWGGHSYGRIAERLSLSESRVHQLHGEALERLRGWMERAGALYG